MNIDPPPRAAMDIYTYFAAAANAAASCRCRGRIHINLNKKIGIDVWRRGVVSGSYPIAIPWIMSDYKLSHTSFVHPILQDDQHAKFTDSDGFLVARTLNFSGEIRRLRGRLYT